MLQNARFIWRHGRKRFQRLKLTAPIVLTPEQEGRFERRLQWLMLLSFGVSALLLVLQYGFFLSPLSLQVALLGQQFLVFGFLLEALLRLILNRQRRRYIAQHKIKYLLGSSVLIQIIFLEIFSPALIEQNQISPALLLQLQIVWTQLYLVANLFLGLIRLNQTLSRKNISPAQIVSIGFAGIILLGAVLLMLPAATTQKISFLDALFTSTSAVCVTGLIVVDTATVFTRTGQLIILALIQLGGLGIMTVTAFFTYLSGKALSQREKIVLRDALSAENLAQLGRSVRAIFVATLCIETIGAALLFATWRPAFPAGDAGYHAIFHAISAFCNAGFSTFSLSVMPFVGSVPVNLTLAGLIILGGLGFSVMTDFRKLLARQAAGKMTFALSIQSRLTLIISTILIFGGGCLFFALEYHQSLRELPLPTKILAAFFQSVVFRTAGFNSVDFSAVHDSTLLLGMMLMFIGAGPGSTAGGIKLTTFGILIGAVVSAARGRTRVEMFRRVIPMSVLFQALVVVTLYAIVVMIVSFLLSITEPSVRPVQILFETVSAIGTVGLSTGITPTLSPFGKLLIILTMFLGRIGPFNLALAVSQKQQPQNYQYPTEGVQIG